MLSVCVPLYNTDVRLLVKQLTKQAEELPEETEILVFDDFSQSEYKEINRPIAEIQGVIYKELPYNSGRVAIRNLLGRSAHFPWLLFMDGDSLLNDPDFLKKYIAATSTADVVCGGTCYSKVPPADKSILLRWVYGTKREQLTAAQRISRSKAAITANNFLIRRELFMRIGFREAIQGYGHEDSVLGYDLLKAGIKVTHINNPVIHAGLESSGEYLLKTRQALDNLLFISRNIITDPDFHNELGMLRLRDKLEKSGLMNVTGNVFRMVEPWLTRNLTGRHPKLLLFDLYRIGYLCHIKPDLGKSGS